MIVLRLIWFLIGAGVAIQYLYWAVMEAAYGLGFTIPPSVTHDWLFLAFTGAGFFAIERIMPEAKKLVEAWC